MSEEIEYTEVEQQQPELSTRVQTWYQKNEKVIIYAVIGLVVLVGGYYAYQYYQNGRNADAKEELYVIEEAFKNDSLDVILKGKNGGMSAIDIADEYSGTKAANLAHYYLGICYRNTGEYEFAIDELKKFSSDDVMISTIALGAIGDSYMELGDLDQAISYHGKAVSNGDNKLTSPIYLFKAGIACEDAQDYAAAEKNYKAIKANYPDSREAQTIDKYIARAEALK